MSKPMIHAQSSAKKYGGKPEDYIDLHQWFDESKAHFPTNGHRALRHHSWGIFQLEEIFGKVRVNSDNKSYSTRDIGEQHVIEDLGFIPTVSDYLQFLEYQDLESFGWLQYSNYFNDGDATPFRVRSEYGFYINGEEANEDCEWYGETNWRDEKNPDYDEIKTKMADDCREFIDSIDEDMMEEIFGNHKQITVTKDGVEVESYTDHD